MPRGRPKKQKQAGNRVQAPHAPAHLTEIERLIFDRVAQVLTEMEAVGPGDADIIALYAQTAALAQHAKQDLDANGPIQVTKNGYTTPTAAYGVYRDMVKSSQKLLADLGLSPASRHRISAVVQKEADEFANFLASKPKT